MKKNHCYVCGREVKLSKGRIPRHFTRSYTGRRELCLGAGEHARPPISEVKEGFGLR